MTQGHFKNGLLQRFDSETIKRLDLKAVDLPVNREIGFPGNRIEHLFFIEEGMASMTTTFDDGYQAEVGLAGWESVQGASVLMGTKKSLNRVCMQVAGHGYTTTTSLAAQEFKRCSVFQDLTLRYLQAQFIQSAQTAACNARQSVQQRLARWLLLCADRNGGRKLPLSHEYMADMLGANRTTVTVVTGQFQSLNLIQYTRGKIQTVLRLSPRHLALLLRRKGGRHPSSRLPPPRPPLKRRSLEGHPTRHGRNRTQTSWQTNLMRPQQHY